MVDALLKTKRAEILRIAQSHGARNLRIFGSIARGDADEESDIDFLVEMEPGRSLLDLGGFLVDLESLLNRPVDVLTDQGIKGHLRDRILREAVPL